MGRKKKPEPGINNLYLISFGDTMTALLAFFIVMNSLATDQTGANLYSGTGSFINVSDGKGVPGLFLSGRSTYPFQMHQAAPIYIVGEEDDTTVDNGSTGPDDTNEESIVKDYEEDQLQRFLKQMQEDNSVVPQDSIQGEVAFDLLKPLPRDEDIFVEELREQMVALSPALRRPGYEMQIQVWATTPAPSAWMRAVTQAEELQRRIPEFLQLSGKDRLKIKASASPWHTADLQRPSVSLLVRKTR